MTRGTSTTERGLVRRCLGKFRFSWSGRRPSGRSVGAKLLLLACGGCTWVQLSDAGAAVEQATASQVAGCQQVGSVSSSTQDRVGIQRSRGKVAEELIVLARNEAATIGGDTIVPVAPPVDGRQDFTVYRCR